VTPELCVTCKHMASGPAAFDPEPDGGGISMTMGIQSRCMLELKPKDGECSEYAIDEEAI